MADVLSPSASVPSPDVPQVSFTSPYTPHCSLSSPLYSSTSAFHCSSTGASPTHSPTHYHPLHLSLPSLPTSHPASIAQLLHPLTLDAAAALHHLSPSRHMRHHLSPFDLDLLHSALATQPCQVECDDLALRLCRDGSAHKCRLYQAGTNPHHISHIATERIQAGEPLGCGIGTLRRLDYLDEPTLPDDSLARVLLLQRRGQPPGCGVQTARGQRSDGGAAVGLQ